ncbi:hypothetical protein LARV_01549 [Longilinea arvoryzae]|uniref:Glycosyltransferase RgtA/B/C/D-like domain-containing protein n=1 Tax=Longilinea arvoryzae TaxID=360412 RepID=A0A0S7BI18_9CHLR|nr:hypothetical protein [Longilinea arvoryzae]GAP13794.1 hypothetical protein LARV_01549 [Longilinea arvoryzae]
MKKIELHWKNALRNPDWIAGLVLAILFWAARYWLVGGFGLYEDDLTIVPSAASMSFGEVLKYIWVYITHLYGHARPLSDSFIYLFSNLGWRLGGLRGIYGLGFLLTLANILLFYALIRRASNPSLAFLAGLAYCLYSADTTQAFLTHSLGVQPSIILLLLAAHAYLSRKKWLAYVLAFVILFSYETPFLVFVAVPLLQRKWDRKLLKEFVLHALILAAMLGAVYLLRTAVGEGRVAGLSGKEILSIPLQQVINGSRVSVTRYFRLAIQVAQRLLQNQTQALPVLVAFVALLVVMAVKVNREFTNGIVSAFSQIRLRPGNFHIPTEFVQLGQLLVCGLVMVAAAYPLTFTTQAFAVRGRESRVHLAAVLGNALLMGILLYAGFALAKRLRISWVASLVWAAWLALLVGYGFEIQADYQKAWQFQKDFWRELVQTAPDAGENTVILVEPGGLQDSVQIDANTWNVPRVLPQLFEMPVGWENPPRVYRLREQWREYLAASETEFLVDDRTVTAPPSLYGKFPAGDVIFIETASGNFVRHEGPLTVGGMTYELRPAAEPVLPQLPHTLLYGLLMK